MLFGEERKEPMRMVFSLRPSSLIDNEELNVEFHAKSFRLSTHDTLNYNVEMNFASSRKKNKLAQSFF